MKDSYELSIRYHEYNGKIDSHAPQPYLQEKTRSQGMSYMLVGSLNFAAVEAMMYRPTRAPRSALIFCTVFTWEQDSNKKREQQ